MKINVPSRACCGSLFVFLSSSFPGVLDVRRMPTIGVCVNGGGGAIEDTRSGNAYYSTSALFSPRQQPG